MFDEKLVDLSGKSIDCGHTFLREFSKFLNHLSFNFRECRDDAIQDHPPIVFRVFIQVYRERTVSNLIPLSAQDS